MNAESHRERRKQVRIELRRDLQLIPQRFEGKQHYVVKDPIRLRYYRFQEREHFLLHLLDGAHTLHDVQQAYEQRFRPERLPLEAVEQFVQQLVTSGLAHSGSTASSRESLNRGRQHKLNQHLANLTNFLAIQVPLVDPDRLLGRMLPWVRWCFAPCSFLLCMGLALGAILLVLTHWETFQARLPAANEFFRFQTALYLWLTLAVVKVLHEFGHGLCCKAYGGEVHRMGLMLLCLAPCLYCDVSDAWMLPSKWRRMAIGFAGIYVELILASLATFIWWNASEASFLHQLCLHLMIVCSVNTVFLNGNPLLRFDGYYILADWLEVPNLQQHCHRFLTSLVLRYGLGMLVPRLPERQRWRQVFFGTYSLCSYCYRWVVTLSILWFLARFLEPYKLGALGGILAVAAAVSMAGWPLCHLVRRLHKLGWRLPDMKPWRVAGWVGAIGTFVLGFFLVPLPFSRVRQVGLIQVSPNAVERVYVQAAGVLQRLHVRDGQHVERGDLLAEFRSLDLENRLAEAMVEHDLHLARCRAQRELTAISHDPVERSRIDVQLGKLTGECERSAQRVVVVDQMNRRLQLRAPRAGVVMGLPRIEEIGKSWESETATPFCTIGDPSSLWVVVPVGPADYHVLREDLERGNTSCDALPVKVRIRGNASHTWNGRVVQLPESEAREVPLPLTHQAGGPVAVKPSESRTSAVPLNQHYLVAVELLHTNGTIYPGNLAQVSIHCRHRTGAWLLWRFVAGAFDLGWGDV
jgi:putative peptide zinc metalloprotease protein